MPLRPRRPDGASAGRVIDDEVAILLHGKYSTVASARVGFPQAFAGGTGELQISLKRKMEFIARTRFPDRTDGEIAIANTVWTYLGHTTLDRKSVV